MVYHRKYERDTLWQSRNGAFDFPHFSGDLFPTIQDAATLLDVFIIATIQQNLGRNECRGIPRRSGLREHPRLPGMLFAGNFPLPFPNAIIAYRTREKTLLRRLKNIGMASKKNCIETP